MPTPFSAATASDPFPRGSIVGDKYRIDGILGTGGMGVVLSATHLALDAPVAIKVLRSELAKNPELASQLVFEARAVARLRSAHVVRIIDVARLPTGEPYIVMEQLRGTDLASLLAESGALTISDAVNYLRQACEGLREAHELGIVHRDLKPENLFLAHTPEGDVLKLLDFGISKYVGGVGGTLRRAPRSTLTKSGTAVGSPFYMAPEQMRAAPDLDARADIWSLGAILYELLTARCPFEAESPAALCAKVMVDDAPSLRSFSESIPERLDVILRRCLEKEPSARFQSVAELSDALSEFATKELANSTRHASGIGLRLDPPSSGRGTLMALAGVCVMLVLAGVAFWQLEFRREARPALTTSALATAVPVSRPALPLPLPLPSAAPDPTTEPAHVAVQPSASAAPSPKPAWVAPHWEPRAPAVTKVEVTAQLAAQVPSATVEEPPPPTPPAPEPSVSAPAVATDPALRYGL
jgi:eukaryotic-like serine/threonine-protein kinase